MKNSILRKKLYNAFAFRFNRLATLFNLTFKIKLNNRQFTVPVIKTLGEVNVYLKDDWFLNLIKSLKLPADTDFLDVGVNVGQSLLTFRSCYNNTYWGFEPNPACVFYLDELIKRNNLNGVNIVPVGLSSTNSIVKLYARGIHDSGATIVSELKPGMFQPGDAQYVPVFSFESLKLDVNAISLIKIDVEGAELDVIKGMLETIRKHQPAIICEILDYTPTPNKDEEQRRATELLDCLRTIDYKVYRIVHKDPSRLLFEEIKSIELKQWTQASLELNDYLFLPNQVAPPHV